MFTRRRKSRDSACEDSEDDETDDELPSVSLELLALPLLLPLESSEPKLLPLLGRLLGSRPCRLPLAAGTPEVPPPVGGTPRGVCWCHCLDNDRSLPSSSSRCSHPLPAAAPPAAAPRPTRRRRATAGGCGRPPSVPVSHISLSSTSTSGSAGGSWLALSSVKKSREV